MGFSINARSATSVQTYSAAKERQTELSRRLDRRSQAHLNKRPARRRATRRLGRL